MAEYDRIQKKQESRAVANNGEVSWKLKEFIDNRFKAIKCPNTQCKVDKISNSGNVIQTERPSENHVEIPQDITLSEDQVGEASQSITYPSVTSCMTVTLILEDGNKIGGHFALYGTLALNMINQMNQIRRGRRVASVVAKGHGSIWGKNLENSDELKSKIRDVFKNEHPDEDFESIHWEVYAEYQSRFVLVNKQDEFKNWISAQFDGVDEVEFQNVEDGDVTIL